MKNNSRFHMTLLFVIIVLLIWSVINPKDLFTWFLEVMPVLIGIGILIFIYPKYKFSNFTYVLITIESVILIVGGHYTYAEMPLFNWIKDIFGFNRNYYDRLGHFA